MTTTMKRSINVNELDLGDVVYAARAILNDGSMPEGDEGKILANEGSRGVIVRIGHHEQDPNRTVFLVRFENNSFVLGNPIGCWDEDLTIH
jgi:nitrogen fixation protein NifZ